MKKVIVFWLAICMVFTLGGAVSAADLEPQAVNYDNDRYETNIREEDGIGWKLELVEAIEGGDQPSFIWQYDWELRDCRYEDGERCEEEYCCYDDFPFFIDDPVWLWVDKDDDDLPSWISSDWRDFITKVMLDPDCDYLGKQDIHEYEKYPWGECPLVCGAREWRECCGQDWGYTETLGCYPECLPCDLEVLYCQYEDTVCVEGDSNFKEQVDFNGGTPCPGPDGCEEEVICNWWHPYGTGPSSSENVLTYDRFEPGDTLPAEKAAPSFEEVVYGWDDGDNPMDKVCFVTRPKWYDWSVVGCDDCEDRVDVVLWSRPKPCCPDSFEYGEEGNYKDCWDDDEACCIPVGPIWAVDKPEFAFVRFFEMDLRNCNNITGIDLDIPVCCYCDDDIMWGVWEWVETDTCDVGECPDFEGTECSWAPLNTDFNRECETPVCGEEGCDCSLELSFSGNCAADPEECNPGDLCEYQDKVFALGWVTPYVVEDVLDNGVPYKVKAWACDPRNVVKADLIQNAVNPDAGITSTDPLFFRLDFEPGTGVGICKVEVSWILDCILENGFKFFYWDAAAEDWVSVPATWTPTSGGECEAAIVFDGDISDLPGVVIGAGDPTIFDPVTPDPGDGNGNGDDNETDETPSATASSDSGSGCSVGGFPAAILLLIAPIAVLLRKRF